MWKYIEIRINHAENLFQIRRNDSTVKSIGNIIEEVVPLGYTHIWSVPWKCYTTEIPQDAPKNRQITLNYVNSDTKEHFTNLEQFLKWKMDRNKWCEKSDYIRYSQVLYYLLGGVIYKTYLAYPSYLGLQRIYEGLWDMPIYRTILKMEIESFQERHYIGFSQVRTSENDKFLDYHNEIRWFFEKLSPKSTEANSSIITTHDVIAEASTKKIRILIFWESKIWKEQIEKCIEWFFDNGGYSDPETHKDLIPKVTVGQTNYEKIKSDNSLELAAKHHFDMVILWQIPHSVPWIRKWNEEKHKVNHYPYWDYQLSNLKPITESFLEEALRKMLSKYCGLY